MMKPRRLSWTSVILLLLFTIRVVGSITLVYAQDGASDLDKVKVGDLAPDFTLEDQNGKEISLSSFRDKKNIILVFYRGRW